MEEVEAGVIFFLQLVMKNKGKKDNTDRERRRGSFINKEGQKRLGEPTLPEG
jgi:hypothetical protein